MWKIEGLDRSEDCVKIVEVARRGGRDNVGCIVLGRGEDDKKVREWLAVAAPVKASLASRSAAPRSGIRWWIGEPRKIDRAAAVAEIARRYKEWVGIFEKAR